ncbi:unannotated protein [freshwater metagenome]|uniref:Unannotated protein n=1 Tax=freshwater metagenome TaxID=449393 RepID=A0A6J7L399_9ZZZZ
MPLVGLDHREFEYFLAFGGIHAGQRCRASAHGVKDPLGIGPTGTSDVDGDAGGFGLDRHAGHTVGEGPGGVGQLRAQHAGISVERMDEVDVELRPVAADEVDLMWQPREGGKVAQGATRHDRDCGRRETRQCAKCRDRLWDRDSGRGILHDRREGAVVVGGHEQIRCARDRAQGGEQIGVEPSARHRCVAMSPRESRNERAQRSTSWANRSERMAVIRRCSSAGSACIASRIACLTPSAS